MTTIEIVTRTIQGREKYLARNRASVSVQTYPHIMHTVIEDTVGLGVAAVNGMLAQFEPQGDYVWLVDDDDYVAGADVIEEIADLIAESEPDAVMVRYGIGTHCVPEDEFWQQKPQLGHISGQCAIASADFWRRTRDAWMPKYAGDFDWQTSVYERADKLAWLPLVAVRTDKPGHGRADI